MRNSTKKKIIAALICSSSFSCTSYASSVQDVQGILEQNTQNTIKVSSINVNSSISFKNSDKELERVISSYLNKELAVSDLNKLKDDITNVYRRQGFITATAYIPVQDIKDNKLQVNVLDGKLGNVTFKNNSKLDDKFIAKKCSALKKGSQINAFMLQDFIYDLNYVDGVKAQGNLISGSNVGETDLKVSVKDSKRYRGMVYTDNFGSVHSGRYRFGTLHNFYNLDGGGANISFGGLISNKDLHDYFIDISILPKSYTSRTRVGINIDHSAYELGNQYAKYGISGDTTTYKLYGTTNLYNTASHKLDLTYGYSYKDITDDISAYNLNSKKHSHAISGGIAGTERWKNNLATYSADITFGEHENDSEYAKLLNDINHTEGSFTKFNGEVYYYNKFMPEVTFKHHTKVQLADRNLDGSEKLTVGGVNGVRAYTSGELPADSGIIIQNAISYSTKCPNLSVDLFLDTAQSRTIKSSTNWSALHGYGIEINYQKPNDYFFKLTYARRIGFDKDMSESAKAHSRTWFVAGKIF